MEFWEHSQSELRLIITDLHLFRPLNALLGQYSPDCAPTRGDTPQFFINKIGLTKSRILDLVAVLGARHVKALGLL